MQYPSNQVISNLDPFLFLRKPKKTTPTLPWMTEEAEELNYLRNNVQSNSPAAAPCYHLPPGQYATYPSAVVVIQKVTTLITGRNPLSCKYSKRGSVRIQDILHNNNTIYRLNCLTTKKHMALARERERRARTAAEPSVQY